MLATATVALTASPMTEMLLGRIQSARSARLGETVSETVIVIVIVSEDARKIRDEGAMEKMHRQAATSGSTGTIPTTDRATSTDAWTTRVGVMTPGAMTPAGMTLAAGIRMIGDGIPRTIVDVMIVERTVARRRGIGRQRSAGPRL